MAPAIRLRPINRNRPPEFFCDEARRRFPHHQLAAMASMLNRTIQVFISAL